MPFIPVVALGNFVFVLLFHILRTKRAWGLLSGAILKFAVLFGGVYFYLNVLGIGKKFAPVVTFLFGWPQLVTAVIGALVAMAVIKAIGRNIEPLDRAS
jgi:hypothetical protein